MAKKLLIMVSGFILSCTLSACGEGWEIVEVRNQVPYTEERTAGPGVAYVRALLLPAKGPVLPPAADPLPLSNAESLFDGAGIKK